jgi:uncharacterized protein
VDALVSAGAGTWDEVAEPYPDFLIREDGSSVTFGWCIRHEDGRCRFLGEEGCRSYRSRPFICRTYPFALVEGELTVSDCPGLGEPVTPEEAREVAEALLERARAEEEDEARVREAYAAARILPGKRCVVDSDGLRILDD